MIEFIVLGKIPGTEIYITFKWIIMLLVAGLVIYDLRQIFTKKSIIKKLTTKN